MRCWLGFHSWSCDMVVLPTFHQHCIRCGRTNTWNLGDGA